MVLQVPPGSQSSSQAPRHLPGLPGTFPASCSPGGAGPVCPRGPSLRPRFGHDGTDWTRLLSASEVWQPGVSPPTLSSFLPKFQPFPVQGHSELPPLCQEGPQQGEAGEGPSQACGWHGWVGKAGAVRRELRRGLWAEQTWWGDGSIASVGQQEPGEGHRSRDLRVPGSRLLLALDVSTFSGGKCLVWKGAKWRSWAVLRKGPGFDMETFAPTSSEAKRVWNP